MQHFEKYLAVLTSCRLFEGFAPDATFSLLEKCGAYTVSHRRGETLVWEHTPTKSIGVLLSGSANAVRLMYDGRRIIMAHLAPGAVYADALTVSGSVKSPVTVSALENDTISLLLPYSGILEAADTRLFQNISAALAEKYFALQERLECISAGSLREKVLTYLVSFEDEHIGLPFLIPFSRGQLAEYLNVNRSALSRELSAMKSEGIIDYEGSSFKLLRR